jgi:hypothetical protein
MRLILTLIACAATLAAQLPQNDKRLVFSTFHGGDKNDDAAGVAVDPDGFIYVTGETESRDLKAPAVGGKPLTAAVFMGYVTKYAPNGKDMVWRYMIGGSSNTVPHAVALDQNRNVYIAGTTGARDFPLMNPVQDKQNGLNICFLMKLSPDGKLLFSTYFGGERNEEGNALAIDSKGNIYLAGRASSTTLPVKNALQARISGGGQDAFIAKYTPDYKLAYATYLGGDSGTDNIYAIATGPDDSLFVTGETMSPNMATKGAYQELGQSYSSYLAKIAPDGSAISYFTYIGWKGGYTKTQALAVDAHGRAYVTGHTSSKQLTTTPNAIQPDFAGGFRDAFLLRLSADGSTAEYLTYLGGSHFGATDPDETAAAVKVDAHGHVYVAGQTASPDFPGSRALQSHQAGAMDAYLLRLDLDNNRIIYSTFWGGGKIDAAFALALGPGEAATIAGSSYSDDLPILNAVQPKLGSANDAFVAQICDPWPFAWPSASFGYVRGKERPVAAEIGIYSGCTQKFDAPEVTVDQPWLTVIPDGKTLPMKLKLEANPDGLEPGTYTATIRVTVPDSFPQMVEVPIVLVVADPPPPPADPGV